MSTEPSAEPSAESSTESSATQATLSTSAGGDWDTAFAFLVLPLSISVVAARSTTHTRSAPLQPGEPLFSYFALVPAPFRWGTARAAAAGAGDAGADGGDARAAAAL